MKTQNKSEPFDLTYLEWGVLKAFSKNSLEMDIIDGQVCISDCPSSHSNIVASCNKAAVSLSKKRMVSSEKSKSGFHKVFITETGLSALEQERPTWVPPKPPELDDSDYEVLNEMIRSNGDRALGMNNEWLAPMDVGGTNGSHHSISLTKLAKNGLVAIKKGSGNAVTGVEAMPKPHVFKKGKGSCSYRITNDGISKVTDIRNKRRK